jgi:hypothetical protein
MLGITMSNFWNRLTGGSEDNPLPEATKPVQSETITAAPAVKSAYGIAQANELMAKLPTSDNADLVVSVIRTTLESVGVHVGQLIAEAKGREGELRTQIEQRRSTIADLERRIDAEREEIGRIEGELSLTTRTREGLERSEVLPPKRSVAPSAAPAPPPLPVPERGSRDSDRPTVMAVPKDDVVQLRNSEFESIPPSDPKLP